MKGDVVELIVVAGAGSVLKRLRLLTTVASTKDHLQDQHEQ